ncbi:MAG: asparagine synthase (glutamine-hydrolyzing), partial [Planctomycetaceae bacterium]
MCGISGILHRGRSTPAASADLVHRMCEAIVHRGPDDEGLYGDQDVALGMRRLSIIDLDNGSQPIFNEDGTVVVVFNGEIYNFRELRVALESRGHRFATASDTEVIVHLYEEYGEDFPVHLNGMFAIALWDKAQQQLLLVRDRLGVKPLYYGNVNGTIIFGSELKTVLLDESVSREVDAQAVYDYFVLGYIPQPRSIYRDIRKLPPGCLLKARDGDISIRRYWSYPTHPAFVTEYEDAKHALRELLTDATRLRMISDVPLGAFLSGGLDSSITVALMAQLSAQPVETFFIDFEEGGYSERKYARAVAARYGTNHHEFVVQPEAVGILDEIVRFFDEPFGDSSAIPTYYLSQMTRRHVTVALAGDGGDESFGGYQRYRTALARRNGRRVRPLLDRIGKGLHRLLPRTAPGRRYFRSLGSSNFEAFAVGTQELETQEILSKGFLRQIERSVLEDLGESPPTNGHRPGDPLAPYSAFDVNWYLPDDILTKVDRMSMAHSLEVRAPFLDYRVIEYAARLPVGWKISGQETKAILKEVFRDDLPEVVLSPRKRGFSIPLEEWFRNELKPELNAALHDAD